MCIVPKSVNPCESLMVGEIRHVFVEDISGTSDTWATILIKIHVMAGSERNYVCVP